ncbi:hypothetical protein [Chryseobacterium flavum]|uniref:hypothetical protein n=1 Tax=Chryseobacterium flavum TaxID=415851 RepID=UPI0028AAD866|nr:hypothetical protein [Chryseobacterium flavum]
MKYLINFLNPYSERNINSRIKRLKEFLSYNGAYTQELSAIETEIKNSDNEITKRNLKIKFSKKLVKMADTIIMADPIDRAW